jgi:hypothetical protein
MDLVQRRGDAEEEFTDTLSASYYIGLFTDFGNLNEA